MVDIPFSWPGNKLKYLEHILKQIPPNTTRFVDVFGGSGAVILNTPFHELDVFNDINRNVANFYTVVQDEELLEQLICKLESIVHSRDLFDMYRTLLSEGKFSSKVDWAFAWYYVIRCSFGQMGRHYGRNMKNSFETQRLWNKISCFRDIHIRLRHCYIESRNAFDLIKEYDRHNTVFYVDPPYINTAVGAYSNMFGPDQHKKLLDLIFSCEGTFIVNGEPHELYDQYKWSFRDSWSCQLRMDNENRSGGRTECLWLKR